MGVPCDPAATFKRKLARLRAVRRAASRDPLCDPCAASPCALFARALLPCTCGSRRMLAACLPVICGDYPASRASLPSSTSPEAGALSLSLAHSSITLPRSHLVDARPGVGGHSLSLSHSLPNAYASFSSRRHPRFRPNPALCHTTARYLALRESPNVGQNRTARLHPGILNGCFGCSGSPLPHCLCQSSARTRGVC